MKKKFWTGRLKTILIIALVVAICAAVTLAIATGTSALENVVGTILSPIRAGVASIDRLAERYYNYMFRYESLAAEKGVVGMLMLGMTDGVGYTGVVQGTFLEDGTEILRMNYLLTDAIVKNNDQVVTTGSTLYPRGLLLGYITNASLDETGVAKYATLEPSCDLGKLEQIAIITQYDLQ